MPRGVLHTRATDVDGQTVGLRSRKVGIGRWITFYNHHSPHTAHGGQPPAVVYFNSIETDRRGRAVA